MVAIAGGHGKIALTLAERLSGRGERVISLIRNPDHADDVRARGGEPVVCDLERADVVRSRGRDQRRVRCCVRRRGGTGQRS